MKKRSYEGEALLEAAHTMQFEAQEFRTKLSVFIEKLYDVIGEDKQAEQ